MVHRHQLDRRHAEVHEILNCGVRREPDVGAADRFRHRRIQLREALDVQLVDDRLVPRRARRPVVAPRERRIEHRGERRVRRRVTIVGRVIRVGGVVTKERRMPSRRPAHDLRVRIEQHLERVEPVARRRIVRAVHAIAVQLARPHVRQVPVPDHVGLLGQEDARAFGGGEGRVEETQFDAGGVLGEDGEVDADAVPRRAKRIRGSWPDAHQEIVVGVFVSAVTVGCSGPCGRSASAARYVTSAANAT